jgi:hypothetical protein
MVKLSPILVSVYNRINHFKACISALQRNSLAEHSELYIVSDAPSREEDKKIVSDIRRYIEDIDGFKKLHPIIRERNMGAFESVTQAAEDVIESHGRLIALEDDIVVSNNFLRFLNEGLDVFETNKNVFSVTGYCPPWAYREELNGKVLVGDFHCPWGFATWADRNPMVLSRSNRYKDVIKDKYAKNFLLKKIPGILDTLREDSIRDAGVGDVRVMTQMLLGKMITIYPPVSLSRNIGHDGSGVRQQFRDNGMQNLLSHQKIYDDYEVKSWEPIDDELFRMQLLDFGRNGKKQLVLPLIYRLGLREVLDPVVKYLRKIKHGK